MAATVAMDLRSASLPLAGGSDGATLALRPLLSGVMRSPPGWFARGDGPLASLRALGVGVRSSELIPIPIVAFLLEHPIAGPVLVDTGFHASVAAGPSAERSRNLGSLGRVMARTLEMRPDQAIAAQLRGLGVDPEEIGLVVMTHLHFDHASALCDFPSATVLVSGPEWAAAHAPRPALHGYSPAQLDGRPRYRTIPFAAAATDGSGPFECYGPFEQTVDVFGDGSLRLAFTPGHSNGHMSVIVRLSDREALLAGDAAYTLATIRSGERPWRSEDGAAFERSLLAIQEYDRENPDALIVPGHDMVAWEQLDELY
jgi:glyoxylase-like metal-dependent hydrolase (beta-lactamase superfamily II)